MSFANEIEHDVEDEHEEPVKPGKKSGRVTRNPKTVEKFVKAFGQAKKATDVRVTLEANNFAEKEIETMTKLLEKLSVDDDGNKSKDGSKTSAEEAKGQRFVQWFVFSP